MKHYDTMTGYKGTDKDMKCKGFQFELGKWFNHDGPIELCKSGFHFCKHPSGPWSYYNDRGTRVFSVEARNVVEEYIPGSELKLVCSEIRLIEEIIPDGNSNTGNRNTGHSNTGNSNTGNWNTGNSNTGDRNTGNSNTGHRNTGDSNTGHRNTGNWNTGNSNTGNRNTGHWNTGHWNATDYCAGFFCAKEPKVIVFDNQTKLTQKGFLAKHPLAARLGKCLMSDAPFDYAEFKSIPGWTLKKCKALHEKHIAGRAEATRGGGRG